MRTAQSIWRDLGLLNESSGLPSYSPIWAPHACGEEWLPSSAAPGPRDSLSALNGKIVATVRPRHQMVRNKGTH